MPNFLRHQVGIAICLLCAGLGIARAQPQIPALTWTQRSDWLNVKSAPFNAYGDGVHDDTAAIQAALTVAGTSYQFRTVYLPSGTYKISNTLNWQGTSTPWTYGCSGVTLVGCGQNTTITWSGSSGQPMFWTKGATRTRYIGISWNGENTASCAYEASSAFLYEGRILHKDESFSNFVVSGTYVSGETIPAAAIVGGLSIENNSPDAEVMIWNCLFTNCTNGVIVGYEEYNNYQWEIRQCEFDGCGNGIVFNDGKGVVLNDHFSGSTISDVTMGAGSSETIRRCISQGSKSFVVVQGGGSATTQLIQDCWVDSWTSSSGAIQLGSRGPFDICDVNFTNSPNSNAPIQLQNSPSCPAELQVSNIYCPSISNLIAITGGGTVTTGTIPLGTRLGDITSLSSPGIVFLQGSPVADSTNILDVTLPPYNASTNGSTNVTTAIQSAINAAKAANNGSIVYLPSPVTKYGGYYVTSTLVAGGSNYTIQGAGLTSNIVWGGATSGTGAVVMTMPDPQDVALEQFVIHSATTVAGVVETATGASSILYDGLYCYGLNSSYNPDGPGLVLSQLPAGSEVYMDHLDAALTVEDCGPAEILGNFVIGGRLVVNGATHPKTGILGILDFQGGTSVNDPNHWDVSADDDQNITIGHYYEEQGFNHLLVSGGAGTTPGHVTVTETKQNFLLASNSNICISINNYAGQVMLNNTNFANSFGMPVVQTGTSAVNLILAADTLGGAAPVMSITSACNLIETEDIITGTTPTYPSPVMPAGAAAAIAAGDDDQRALGDTDLNMRFGIQNTVGNPSAEADAANPNPTAALGYTPSCWTVSGSAVAGFGIRNVTVQSGTASPFGAGNQSMLFIDTTGTSTGSPLQLSQQTAALLPSQGAVLTFDFCLNSLASLNDDVWARVFASGTQAPALSFHLGGDSTGGTISANVNGVYETLASLSLGAWYRVRCVIQPPNSGGSANVHLFLYQWTGGGYSTVTLNNGGWIDALASPVTAGGLNEIEFNAGGAGENTSIDLDNVTLMAGDPLLNNSGQLSPNITSSLNVTGTSTYPFNYQITANHPPDNFTVNQTQLPPGLGFNASSGAISGTPTETGTFAVSISAANEGGTDNETLSITILQQPPVITSTTSVTGTYGLSFGFQVAATGDPFNYSASGLPPGLTLNPDTGFISGTPTQSGRFIASISATGSAGGGPAAQVPFTINVNFNSLQGTYNGLAGIGGTENGFFTLTMNAKGAFTAMLKLATGKYSFKSSFGPGYAMLYTAKIGQTLLQVMLGAGPSAAELSGTIVMTADNLSTTYDVNGFLVKTYKSTTLPVTIARRYTFQIPAIGGTDPTLPQAPGYGTMTVNNAGLMSVGGKLGDGTAFSASGQLGADGKTWTLFKALYGSGRYAGSIAGTLIFEDLAGSDCDGTLEWMKPPQKSGNYYPHGFSAMANFIAAEYREPPLATGTTATFTLGGGDLPAGAINDDLMVSTASKVTVSGSNDGKVSFTLFPGTGLFSGGFFYSGMNKNRKIPFTGALYQKPVKAGVGQFLGSDQSGAVQIAQ